MWGKYPTDGGKHGNSPRKEDHVRGKYPTGDGGAAIPRRKLLGRQLHLLVEGLSTTY